MIVIVFSFLKFVFMQKNTIIPLPNWESISVQTANFFFSEAEKRLQESVSAYTANKEAAYKVLGIILPIVTISIGYIFNANLFSDFQKLVPALAFTFVQISGVGFIIWSLYARNIQTIGTMPIFLIKNDQIIPDDEKLQYVGILLNQCENIQDRIENNTGINTRCANFVNIALVVCGVLAPAIFVIVSLCLR